MKAFVLAAGRGERMRPLTLHTPKPLLPVAGKPLIVWHLEKLAAFGVTDVIINTSHLAEQFAPTLGDGSRWGLRLHFLHEGTEPLETGGGMLNALPLLGDAPFIAINGDIWTDVDLAALPAEPRGLAHLVMVDNPPQHPQGDFHLDADGCLQPRSTTSTDCLTYSGIGLYRGALLDDWQSASAEPAAHSPPRFKLAPLLIRAMQHQQITGQHHLGRWTDVGTPERLQQLEKLLEATS